MPPGQFGLTEYDPSDTIPGAANPLLGPESYTYLSGGPNPGSEGTTQDDTRLWWGTPQLGYNEAIRRYYGALPNIANPFYQQRQELIPGMQWLQRLSSTASGLNPETEWVGNLMGWLNGDANGLGSLASAQKALGDIFAYNTGDFDANDMSGRMNALLSQQAPDQINAILQQIIQAVGYGRIDPVWQQVIFNMMNQAVSDFVGNGWLPTDQSKSAGGDIFSQYIEDIMGGTLRWLGVTL